MEKESKDLQKETYKREIDKKKGVKLNDREDQQ